jgi:hypothetical protein
VTGTDPNFTTAFDVASHRLAGRFNLAAGDALVIEALQAIIAKCNVITASGVAFVFADADFAVRNFFR